MQRGFLPESCTRAGICRCGIGVARVGTSALCSLECGGMLEVTIYHHPATRGAAPGELQGLCLLVLGMQF